MSLPASQRQTLCHSEAEVSTTAKHENGSFAMDASELSDGQETYNVPRFYGELGGTYRTERRESFPYMELGFARFGLEQREQVKSDGTGQSKVEEDLVLAHERHVEMPPLDVKGNLASDSKPHKREPVECANLKNSLHELFAMRRIALAGFETNENDDEHKRSPKARGKQSGQCTPPDLWDKKSDSLANEPQLRGRSRGRSRRPSERQSTAPNDISKSRSSSASSRGRDSIIRDEDGEDIGGPRYRDSTFPELTETCADYLSFRASQANNIENDGASPSGWLRQFRLRIAEFVGRYTVNTGTRRNQYTDTPFPLHALACGLRPRSGRRPRKLRKRQQVQGNNQIETTPCVSLEEFPIGSSPPFIALSYVWGSDVLSQNIRVNGEPFAIRENLTAALKLLQLLCPDMYIWTDAICINQANEEEKSHLVQHMGQIFNAAEKVYAWLGPADPGEHGVGDSSDALWDHLQQLGDLFWEHTGHDKRLDQMPFDMDPILERLLPDLNARMTKPSEQDAFPTLAYSRFSNRVYWQRVWVLQEAYLARELVFCCGSKTMISQTLAGALILLESYKKYVVSNSTDVHINPKLQEFAFTAPCYPEMHRLIIYTSIYVAEVHSLRIAMTNFCVKELPRGSQSTDPRDMVFGLLGFANQEERGYIKVNYKKTVQEVYRDTTRELMRRGWTDILAWSQPPEKRIPELPSWVPDFSSTIYETMCSQGQAKSWLSQFNASASLPPTFYTGDIKGDWGLRWPGVVVDVIDQIGSLWHPRGDPLDPGRVQGSAAMQSRSASYEAILTYLSEVKRFTEESIRIHPVPPRSIPYDNVARLEAAWRIPCADQSAYKAVLEDATRCVNEAGDSDSFKVSDESRPYVETILRWVKKRPMLGILGHVGLVAGDTQKGDVLVLLQNCSAPYVLRKRFSNPLFTSYDLVGEAFIWGIMDGEYKPRKGQEFIFDIL
ncbi:heterokaryon incompatibility protein-domain-containing protein [Xylariaceae sp. AK1471]|nr:heterokaryon incompatibility protein-domain-containing protein [Xylariaceae sp. AK1471]